MALEIRAFALVFGAFLASKVAEKVLDLFAVGHSLHAVFEDQVFFELLQLKVRAIRAALLGASAR